MAIIDVRCKLVGRAGRGRPRFPLRDIVFAVVFKVCSTYSGRRFTGHLCDAQAKGHISRVPHYNAAFKYIENPNLYPILLSWWKNRRCS